MRRRKIQPVEQRCVERLSILLHLSRSSLKTDFSQKKASNAELKNSVYARFGACAEPPCEFMYASQEANPLMCSASLLYCEVIGIYDLKTNNNTQCTAVAPRPSTTHPLVWAEQHKHTSVYNLPVSGLPP